MKVALVAAELSGDRLGGALARELRARNPEISLEGIAGPEMRAAGCTELVPVEDLCVMGLVEVLRHYRRLRRIRDALRLHWLRDPPDIFVGIDAPDFNLGLARELRRARIPTVQYVGPTVWAWRAGRVRTVAAAVDRLLTIFPFEPPLYAEAGVDTVFVGHPLARELPAAPDRAAARDALGLANGRPVLAVLAGSRVTEVRAHVAPFLAAAAICSERFPDLEVVCAAPTAGIAAEVAVAAAAHGHSGVDIRTDETRRVLIAADAVLTVSGTATLEAMLCKRPLVAAYRTSWLSFQIARRLVRVPYVALPNILAGERLVPEFVQGAVQARPLADALTRWLHGDGVAALEERFRALHTALTGDRQVADAVLEVVA